MSPFGKKNNNNNNSNENSIQSSPAAVSPSSSSNAFSSSPTSQQQLQQQQQQQQNTSPVTALQSRRLPFSSSTTPRSNDANIHGRFARRSDVSECSVKQQRRRDSLHIHAILRESGIPQLLRAPLWLGFSGALALKMRNRGLYATLLEKVPRRNSRTKLARSIWTLCVRARAIRIFPPAAGLARWRCGTSCLRSRNTVIMKRSQPKPVPVTAKQGGGGGEDIDVLLFGAAAATGSDDGVSSTQPGRRLRASCCSGTRFAATNVKPTAQTPMTTVQNAYEHGDDQIYHQP